MIADTAETCCIAVTLIPCPNAVVANSKSFTLSRLNSIPVASPVRSIPVFLPKPRSVIYLNRVSFPSFNPKFTNPGLQEFSTTCMYV